MKALKDQIAIVTGASRGIGVHIAETLASHGVHLSLAARDEDALEAVAETLRAQYKVRILVVPTDVSQRSHLQRLVHSGIHCGASAVSGRLGVCGREKAGG